MLSSLWVVFVLFIGDNAARIWRFSFSNCTVTSDSRLLETIDIVVLSGSCWSCWSWSIWLCFAVMCVDVGIEVEV